MNDEFRKSVYDKIFSRIYPKLLTGKDRIKKEKFSKKKDENFEIIHEKIDNRTYKFTKFKELKKNNRKVYIPTVRDHILLEYIRCNIEKKYKLKMANRSIIISELTTLLNEPIEYYIIRLDIKEFFESIDHNLLLQRIKKTALFNIEEIYLITQLLSSLKTKKGIPQGISVSNYLAELFMEKFDIAIKHISSRIIYYVRYVDDILIVIPEKLIKVKVDEIEKKIKEIFLFNRLEINNKKSKYLIFKKDNSTEFEYLGYTFCKKDKKLEINIAKNKLRRMYKKIDWIFNEYNTMLDYQLLLERLKVFSSVNKIYKNNRYFSTRKEILFGINVDYKYISTNESIKKLNLYIKRYIVNMPELTRKQRNKLYALCIPGQDEKYRIISYNNIPITSLRSIIHNFHTIYSWQEIISFRKQELIDIYFYCTVQMVLES